METENGATDNIILLERIDFEKYNIEWLVLVIHSHHCRENLPETEEQLNHMCERFKNGNRNMELAFYYHMVISKSNFRHLGAGNYVSVAIENHHLKIKARVNK